jgi:tetratricopeptide (TPR) repeat protein
MTIAPATGVQTSPAVAAGPDPSVDDPSSAGSDAPDLFSLQFSYARILVDVDRLDEAERAVAALLDERPDDLDALSLYTKVLHMCGKISQALACWAQIHARSPHNENALAYLAAILSFARDPERGAGEFFALGQIQLARKPRVQVDLEEAFVAFLQRRPAEARAACDAIARRGVGRDAEQTKLALLAKAWIPEMSADLDIARDTLEEMGKLRGLEADTDRILSLVRVYERIGGRAELEAAVQICRFLEKRFEKMSLLLRLASIHARLGQSDEAARYRARYLERFRARMHRPSRAELLAVAAWRYLPLALLARVRTCDGTPPSDPSPRQRAVAAALDGATTEARSTFERTHEPIDVKYLADLAEIDGDAGLAARLRLEALRDDPADLHVLGALLDTAGADPAIASAFLRDDMAERARWTLESALRQAPLRADLWRRFGALLLIAGRTEESARHFTRAEALDEAARRDRAPIGRAQAAAVYQLFGKAKGLIHEIWAGRRPADAGRGGHLDAEDVLGNLTPEMARAVRNTFFSVREYARSKLPNLCRDVMDWSYTYKVTKEDEPSGGLSAGLPSALALLSAIVQRPLSQRMASTGLLVADAHDVLVVRRVGDAPQKVKAAYHKGLDRLLVPVENREDLDRGDVPPEIRRELVRYVANFDEAVTLAFGDGLWTT